MRSYIYIVIGAGVIALNVVSFVGGYLMHQVGYESALEETSAELRKFKSGYEKEALSAVKCRARNGEDPFFEKKE